MNRYTISGSTVVLSLAFAACSGEARPSKAEIEQAISGTIPAFSKVSSFSIDATQNMGTKVEPLWHSRFRATVRLLSKTFASDGQDGTVVFVRPVKNEGETTEFFGKAVSRLYAGTWRTAVEFEGASVASLGLPENSFGPGRVIIRGTDAEAAYFSEQDANRLREAAVAEREAEERRLLDERARIAREARLRSELAALETAECTDGEQELPSKSEKIFVLNSRRSCWTPWIVFTGSGSFELKERGGNLLVQIVFRDGSIGEPFEDGPGKTFNLGMRFPRKMRFKSLGKADVTVMLAAR